ncbi:hypothetical protein [Chicken microvirus mg7_19]|nr:hypothetical protein [Chicken microvirus mg7_19]QIR82396.1 hypothetical protein [Chicken microvirus mg8_102]
MARKTTTNRLIRQTQANSLRHSGHPLTYVRYLTGSRLSAFSGNFRNDKTARVSSQSGARFWNKSSTPLEYLGVRSVERVQASLKRDVDRQTRICNHRKERREVLFAKGKVGGRHKPPTYTINSLVRC